MIQKTKVTIRRTGGGFSSPDFSFRLFSWLSFGLSPADPRYGGAWVPRPHLGRHLLSFVRRFELNVQITLRRRGRKSCGQFTREAGRWGSGATSPLGLRWGEVGEVSLCCLLGLPECVNGTHGKQQAEIASQDSHG